MRGFTDWGAAEQGWRKGPWTPEEDKLLADYVKLHGEGRWSSVAKSAGLNRSRKSCRLRWVNYLRPGLKKGHITPQEEGIIIELHALWGNKWSTIARYLPGRTDNEIKNYWRTHFKKRGKASQKQEKRKAQALKRKQRQGNDANEAPLSSSDSAEDQRKETTVPEKQSKTGGGVMLGYFSGENRCLPIMYQQQGQDFTSWYDIAMEDGLWGGLWNLDDDSSGRESKMAGPNQASNFWNDAGYIF
ncbi:hypothetical protein NMG60_11006303 [Bertholletia excelsa]